MPWESKIAQRYNRYSVCNVELVSVKTIWRLNYSQISEKWHFSCSELVFNPDFPARDFIIGVNSALRLHGVVQILLIKLVF